MIIKVEHNSKLCPLVLLRRSEMREFTLMTGGLLYADLRALGN